jgi:hypothetical protein
VGRTSGFKPKLPTAHNLQSIAADPRGARARGAIKISARAKSPGSDLD